MHTRAAAVGRSHERRAAGRSEIVTYRAVMQQRVDVAEQFLVAMNILSGFTGAHLYKPPSI